MGYQESLKKEKKKDGEGGGGRGGGRSNFIAVISRSVMFTPIKIPTKYGRQKDKLIHNHDIRENMRKREI